MEQVREIDGEQAYEKMRRAMEKADQEKASQEKARQVERARQVEKILEASGAQKAGVGLWPQPLRRSARRGVLGSG